MEKRSIFRALKKMVGSVQKGGPKIKRNFSLQRNLYHDDVIDQPSLKQYIKESKECLSFDHYLKKGRNEGFSDDFLKSNIVNFKNSTQRYIDIIGDPCYRYKRVVKERFFKCALYRRVFLHSYFFLKSDFQKKGKPEVI